MNENEIELPDRGTPMSTNALHQMLTAGPSPSFEEPELEAFPDVPPLVERELLTKPTNGPISSEQSKEDLSANGPREDALKNMILPSEREKAILRKKFPGIELKVIPFPYSGPNGKMQCYIVRPLTFSQWRSCEVTAAAVAESKPAVPIEEILAEKVVSMALTWPAIPEQELMTTKAGLVPTLYGVIQQLCLFFNPDTIARMAFTL